MFFFKVFTHLFFFVNCIGNTNNRFMDLIMPELDGIEAVKIIRETDTTTPIVALTANATTGDRDGCYDVGMNDFITKPISMDGLRKVIQKVTANIPLSNQI
jgi:CheY-like chemotaxis protein